MTHSWNRWFKLDNAGKIFPVISNGKRSNYFRVAVELTEPIDPIILQKALEVTLLRFPIFNVQLKQGLFWYYLDTPLHKPQVELERNTLGLYPQKIKNRRFLFRVLYYHHRIAIELFHSLTDGTGAMEFLKTLTLQYLREKGYPVGGEGIVLESFDPPRKEEMTDSFLTLFDGKNPQWDYAPQAYHLPGTFLPYQGQHITHAHISSTKLNAFAKSKGITLTTYLTSVLMFYLLKQRQRNPRDKRPIIVDIPVNLRRFYPSHSLRNFVLFINVGGVFPLTPTLEDIQTLVQKQMKEGLRPESLTPRINANVSAEKRWSIRLIPMALKKFALKIGFHLFGERILSFTLSNLGRVEVSPTMKPYLHHFEFVLCASRQTKIAAAMCTYEDDLVLSFTRTIVDQEFIRDVLLHLTNETKLSIQVSSNQWGESL